MFGSATNTLALIGACAIVFWIICWTILASKSDIFPHWLQNSFAALCAVLAFCTAIPSALLGLPIWLNFLRTYDEIRRSEYQRGLDEKFSESSKQLRDAYDSGYRAAERAFHAEYDRFIRTKNRELYEAKQAQGREEHHV